MIWAYLTALLGIGGVVLSSHIPPGPANLVGLLGGGLVVAAVQIGYAVGRRDRR